MLLSVTLYDESNIDNMRGLSKRVGSGKLLLRKKGGTYGSKNDPQEG